jgi:uncharacterized membrane protein YsdA (DUF1294 family)
MRRESAAMGRTLWLALAFLNVVTFCVYGYDKMCSKRGWRRVAEANLLWFAFLCGWIGAWTAMSFFRHKTQKRSFRWKLIAVTVLNPFWLVLFCLKGV